MDLLVPSVKRTKFAGTTVFVLVECEVMCPGETREDEKGGEEANSVEAK